MAALAICLSTLDVRGIELTPAGSPSRPICGASFRLSMTGKEHLP